MSVGPGAVAGGKEGISNGARVLSARGIEKSYETPRGRLQVLSGLDLDVPGGTVLAILGVSGSGKSTLLNILGTLDRPDAGTLEIGGERVDGRPDRALAPLRARRIGFVFQFHHLLPAFSALENAMMPGIIAEGRATDAHEAAARELLRRVGLEAHSHKKPNQLSGGQQQRVAIARALLLGPRLILADEPTGNLDTHTADEIFALMREVNRERGSACLIVTHDPRLAERCDRAVTMIDGRLRAD